jgi:hypothetical protein
LTSHRTSNLNKEKGKAPMASNSQKNHAYLYGKKFTRRAHNDRCCNKIVSHVYHDAAFNSHVMFAFSSSFTHDRSRPRHNHVVPYVPRNVCTSPTTIYQTCDASFVLSYKNAKVVARKLGSKCKRDNLHLGSKICCN